MTLPQFNNMNGMPSPEDHLDQGKRVLQAALELVNAGFRVFPVHGLRWVRVVVPVGAATAVPGGDIAEGGRVGGGRVGGRVGEETEQEKEEELEVRWRVEMRCTCGVVSCANIGKHPVGVLVPHGSKDASTDELQVKSWFAVPSLDLVKERGWVPWNLAIATGQGLVVIDAEAKQIRADLPTGLDVVDSWEEWTRGTVLPPVVGQAQTTLVVAVAEDGSISLETRSSGDLVPAAPDELGVQGVERQGYWPGTLRVQTGSGGLHIYLQVDPNLHVKSRNRVLPAIDIKADGGYVLAPPSRHASGGVYAVLEGKYSFKRTPGAIAPVADDLKDWLLSVKGGRFTVRRLGDTSGSGMPELYDFTLIMANGCPAGFRDYFINDLCFRLRRKGVSLEDAAQAVRQQWARMEQPADSDFSWSTCVYKLKRVWDEVTPEEVTDLPAWRPPAAGQMAQVQAIGPAVAEPVAQTVQTAIVLGETPSAGGTGAGAAGAAEAVSWRLLERRDLTMLLTDTGNAMRFAQRMREQVRYSPELDRWFVWDGTRWAPDVLGQAMLLTKEIVKDLYEEALDPSLSETDQVQIQRWADQSQSAARRQAMLLLAQSEPGIGVKTADLDADPMLLVVPNGTLDLATGTLRESLATDMNTMCAGVVYDPSAKCPGWVKHVEFVTGGDQDLARYLQRAIGYTLTGKTKEQKLFFLHGNGDNGKNVFMDVIAAMLGDYAIAADENFLSGGAEHPTQLAGLQGKRLIYADETDEGRKIRESRIKHLTGSKTIKARFMRQNYFEFTPRFKIWVMGNHKPSITGNDDGIWRRIELVPFTQKIAEEDKVQDFDQILIQDELSGILNWAIEGLKMWNTTGLSQSKVVKKATALYREDEDSEGEFFAEKVVKCSEEEGGVMVFSTLFQEYRLWCAMTGTEEKSKKSFAQELERRGFTRPDSVRRIAGYTTAQRVWLGGRLRTSLDADV